TDADAGDTITYSLTGPDAAAFSIDGTTGEVRFLASPDYENPTDANTNNAYLIVVHANDTIHDTTQGVIITVTNVGGVTINGSKLADTVDATHGAPLPTGEEDTINGGAGADIINALGGNDLINGGPGPDMMTGGTGNDTYVVDVAGDVVTEN